VEEYPMVVAKNSKRETRKKIKIGTFGERNKNNKIKMNK
jgi:hypothetical protein